ncbi:hypothetical protein [uncultured Lactobacillus sp.]|uniref:hypothetical protein n=1 Tax=uncultured Lactobacillus sp. TaxID=153152 RepID=UPI0023C7B0E5|nr:hypothetical protein [uncultured Lactobacillus sp.]MDE7056132.1 hypothetical protein [Lactobacillus sp.]
MSKENKTSKSRQTQRKNIIRNYIIGAAIGILFIIGGVTALGARYTPKYDNHAQNTWEKLIDANRRGLDVIGGTGAGIKDGFGDLFTGKGLTFGEQIGKNVKNGLQNNAAGRQTLERGQYAKRFNDFTKNSKNIGFNGDTLDDSLSNEQNPTLLKVGKDSKLSDSQNNAIDKEFTSNYNDWLNKYKKKNRHDPSISQARYEAMNLMADAYNKVLGKDNKRAKEVSANLDKQKEDSAKENKSTDGKAKNEDNLSLSGKIAQALLNMFYSTSIGDWMASSGPGATIFSTSYEHGETGPQTYSRIARAYNNNIYSTVFAETADTKSISNIGEQMGPMFMALAGVLIVITLILQAGKMGFGQAFSPERSRVEWYQNLIDTMIAVVGCCSYGLLVNMILTINGSILIGLARFMAVTKTATGYTIMSEAITLGYSKDMVTMLTNGTFLGSEFAGIMFSIIYLLTYIGLAVYLKYYYFVREIVFVILWVLGPIFIAFWPSNWGKWRSVNWFRQFCSTVFIQSIHALAMTFMATLMAWNNSNWAAMSSDIASKSAGQASSETLGKIGGDLTSFNVIGAGWHLVTGAGQAAGVIKGGSAIKNGAQHFETMVIGFIILILFQPLSKALADLFGVDSWVLDSIHQSTSSSLKTTAMLAGGGMVAGAGALALGTGTAGLSMASGANALKAGASAAKVADKGAKAKAFKKAFAGAFNNSNVKVNRMRDKASKTLARVNGIAGKSVGQLVATAVAQGAGEDIGTTIALSRVGGEIGDRAASLSSGKLSKLGLKNADPNRKRRESLKKDINGITNKATKNSVKASIDNAAGFDEQIRKASADPNLSSDTEKQQAIKEAQENANFAKENDLDKGAAAEAKAKRLTKGKNNYKSTNAINRNFRDAIMADDSLSEEQKKAALQQGDQAMIKAGSAAYDPKIMYDQIGYAEAQNASTAAKAATEAKLRSQFEAGKLEGAPTPDQISFDDWKQTPEFGKKYGTKINEAGRAAAQEALNNSNGHFYGSIDDKAFQSGLKEDTNSVINSDIFKQEVTKGLQSIGMSSTKANQFASIADNVEGRSLVQSVPTLNGNGEEATILDAGLWRQLNSQSAGTVNSTWGGLQKISGQDLDNTFTPEGGSVYGSLIGKNTSIPSANDIDSFVNNQNKSAAFAESQKNWAQFKNMSSATSEGYDPSNPLTWFTNPSQDKWERDNPGFNDLNAPYGTFGHFNWNTIAQDRITNNPNIQPDILGMTLAQANDILPKVVDTHGKVTGVEPGTFRMQINNTHSILQAQNGNGSWFNVGNIGRGDGTLTAGQTVYQDLDLSSNGTPSLRYDQSTHSVSTPYSLENNQRIPVSLTNGIPELGSFFTNPTFVTNTPLSLGDFAHMPSSEVLNRARNGVGSAAVPTLDQYSNYSDFALQGNNGSYIITGMNAMNGKRELLTELAQSTSELNGLPANTSFYIPLVNNGETGLDISSNADPQLFFNSNIKQSEKKLAHRVLDGFMNDSQRIDHVNAYLHDNILPYTSTYLRNFIANNPANLDGTNLDTFYKGIYD